MAAINPTQNTALIVDEFIRYATQHLTTVSGLIDTISLYQVGPATVTQPGKLFWTGYTVQPSRPTQQFTADDFPQTEESQQQFSKRLTEEENTPIGIDEVEVDEVIQTTIDEALGVRSIEDDYVQGTFNEGKPFVTGFRGGGGFSSGFTGGVKVDLGEVNLGADWVTLASQFIAKNERFTERATWDYNAYRLGFGSDKILGSDGKVRDVLPTPAYYRQTGEKVPANGDRTTVDAALKMLQYEVSVSYKNRLVGTRNYQISEATFNKMNNRQKAALISYVYNAGSLYPQTAKQLNEGNYAAAVATISTLPNTAQGVVLKGLIRRRAEEGALFSS